MKKRPLALIVAMKDEFNYIKEQLQDIKIVEIDGYDFYEGKIDEYPVVICHSKIMTINATMATVITIKNYNPIAILNEGTSGGHSKEIHVGDIIIGEKSLNILSSETVFRKKGEGSNSLDWKLVDYIEGEECKVNYHSADNNLIEIAQKIKYPYGKVYTGIIGSADIWNKEYDRITMLNEKYGILCEDMEAVAIYTVANNFGIPAIGIKVISNNEILEEKYDIGSALKCQKFCYDFIKEYIKGIK